MLTPNKSKAVLEKFLLHNDTLKKPMTICIQGYNGVGKTAIVNQVGEKLGKDVHYMNLAAYSEAAELVGLPLKEFKFCNLHGECEWVPERLIDSMISLGWTYQNDTRQVDAIPSWVKQVKEGDIVLLDDFSRTTAEIQQAIMQLILDYRYASWSLPPKVSIVLTSNPDDGNYNVQSLDNAQADRYLLLNMKSSANDWAEAMEGELRDHFINFILFNKEIVDNYGLNETNWSIKDQYDRYGISPRKLSLFFTALGCINNFTEDMDYLRGLSASLTSDKSSNESFVTSLLSFLRDKDGLMALPSPKDLLGMTTKDCVATLKKYQNQIGTKATLMFRLASYCQLDITDKECDKLAELLVELINEPTSTRTIPLDMQLNLYTKVTGDSSKHRNKIRSRINKLDFQYPVKFLGDR